MKRILFAAIILLAGTTAFGQRGKVTTALSLKDGGKLDKAWEAIQETVDPNNPKAEKSINWANSWEARGEILEAIIKSTDANLKSLVANPVEEAQKSFLKAVELSAKGGSPALKLKLLGFVGTLTNLAIESFQAEDYKKSTEYFEMILALEETPVMKTDTPIDTAIMYNTGLAAINDKQFDKAIKYFTECANYGYNGGSSYSQIISAYQQKGDTATSVNIMKEAFDKYPEDQSILVQLINYYITTGKPDEAISYLDKAIEKEKDNPSFYLAKGVALDKLGRQEDAIKEYLKATEVKADYADAYYNIGVIYFNRGVKQFEVANAVPTNEQARYEAEKAKSDEEFAKAVPYLEKAVEYNPNDSYIKEQLKNLYYRLKMMDKFEQLNQ